MEIVEFLRSKHYILRAPIAWSSERGWSVTTPGNSNSATMTVDELWDLGESLGWSHPADENGYYRTREKGRVCERCNQSLDIQAAYTDGVRIYCAICKPMNAFDRRNRQSFLRAEAAYLEGPE